VASVLTFLAIIIGPCLGPLGATLGLVGAVLGKIELDMIRVDTYTQQSVIRWARFAFYGGIIAVVIDMLVFVVILIRE
jgi:succinate-acetate transporter protein